MHQICRLLLNQDRFDSNMYLKLTEKSDQMGSRSDPYIYLCLAADAKAVEATQNEFRAGLWQENRRMAINSKNKCTAML